MSDYAPPPWGHAGKNSLGLSLDVIKSGVIIHNCTLFHDKSFCVFGRMENSCDIILQHPSISRIHAVLQLDEKGLVFLYDLDSTHGTYVNKKRVKARTFALLNVGDLIRFGESTRLYIVCGSEHKREQAQDIQRTETAKRDEYASWGLQEDAIASSDSEESDSETIKANKEAKVKAYEPFDLISMAHTKEFERIQKRKQKIQNLQREIDRIVAKEDRLTGGLTAGQEKALGRNHKQIERLELEIESLEMDLQNRQRQKSRSSGQAKKKRAVEAYDYESDEDEFYDRTKAVHRTETENLIRGVNAIASQPLTYTQIQSKIEALETSLAAITEQQSQNQMKSETDNAQESDSLDTFMQRNTNALQGERQIQLKMKRKEVEEDLILQRQLLKIATPALHSISGTQALIQAERKEATAISEEHEKIELISDAKPCDLETKDILPKQRTKVRKRSRHKPIGPSIPASEKLCNTNESVLEGGDSVWLPPVNQSGDGKTALNEKYGY